MSKPVRDILVFPDILITIFVVVFFGSFVVQAYQRSGVGGAISVIIFYILFGLGVWGFGTALNRSEKKKGY